MGLCLSEPQRVLLQEGMGWDGGVARSSTELSVCVLFVVTGLAARGSFPDHGLGDICLVRWAGPCAVLGQPVGRGQQVADMPWCVLRVIPTPGVTIMHHLSLPVM